MTQKNQQATLSLYGNLGGDPEPHSVPAKSGTRSFYDPIIDDVVEREYQLPERNFLTFSLATGGYGDKPLRWHYCVDWEGLAFRLRKGDRVKLTGYFEKRTYEKDGEQKTVRQFVVVNLEPLKLKVREEVA
jgi:single-stranded DNA-binding protein